MAVGGADRSGEFGCVSSFGFRVRGNRGFPVGLEGILTLALTSKETALRLCPPA